MPNITVKLRVFKEEDRQLVAGILAKNGYGVKTGKDYRIGTSGKPTKAVEYYVIVEDAQEANFR